MIWTGQQLDPDSPLYNMALRFDLLGAIDPTRFERAFQSVVDRSDALRTVYVETDGEVHALVRDEMPARVDHVDLSAEADPLSQARAWITRRCRRPFDLGRTSFDAALLALAPEHFVWFLDQHHITTDAWSTSLVFRHTAEAYARLATTSDATARSASPLPPFADQRRFEARQRESEAFARSEGHWAAQRERPRPRLALYGIARASRAAATDRIPCRLGSRRSERLRALAEREDVRTLSLDMTLFNLFATAFIAYLSRVSGQQAVVLGTPAHNRSSRAARETIGLFMEIFPLQVEVEPGSSFSDLHAQVRREGQALLRHARAGASSVEDARDIHALLNFIHARFGDFAGIEMRPEWVHAGFGDPRHAIRLQVHDFEDAGDYLLYFDVNRASIPPRTRETLAGHFLALLDGLLDDSEQPIDGVRLISPAEAEAISKRLQADRDQTTAPGPPQTESTVLEAFERRCDEAPDAIAVRVGDDAWRYGALRDRARAFAGLLASRLGPAGGRVALCLPRDIDFVTAVLGSFYAGASWVPLDPGYPDTRMDVILDDLERDGRKLVIVTSDSEVARFAARACEPFAIDAVDWETLPSLTSESLYSPRSQDLAYTLYTSGSTGRPKGVLVDHAGLASYVLWGRQVYASDAPGEHLAFAFCTPPTFDLTITSLFVPLVSGGSIVVYPSRSDSADLTILDVVEDDAVDVLKLTPSHLALLRDRSLERSRIRRLIVGGEDLTTELARQIDSVFGHRVEILNEYGPTEAVVGCMLHRFDRERDREASVPIGRPAAGREIHLLDAAGNPVPDGVPGELFVGGAGIARGYLDRPDETARRFLDDPGSEGGRVYRTGDRALRNERGELVYLGREDDQLKIQGVRIEPGEILHHLGQHPGIREVALDVVRIERPNESTPDRFCSRCGLASNYPDVHYDADDVCNLCRAFEGYRDRVEAYFGTIEDLEAIFDAARARAGGDYDCLVLLSGGKDSTYALYRVVGLMGGGTRVLAATLDNGFISDGAKQNVAKTVRALGVDHVYMRTPAMNEIFVDSLERHSNVCHGCFKTIYTLATGIAHERRIPIVVTGLSRGQLFETRLSEELFLGESFDADRVDRGVLEARKAYHRVDDAVSRLLDTELFQSEEIFDRVEFIDFYRYCNVELEEMLRDLRDELPWVRPADTGRSTNCLINDAGIFVHKRKEGFHNYALPYSWDVRVGHKDRAACLAELDDAIDTRRVHEILDEIGYGERDLLEPGVSERLAAYFVADVAIEPRELSEWLGARLPSALVPSYFVQIERLPLTAHGKLDRAALPAPVVGRPQPGTVYVEPRGPLEEAFAEIWKSVLRVPRVGRHDNYFDVGGDSISAIRILARIVDAGYALGPADLFEHQTIAELSAFAESRREAHPRSTAEAEDDGAERFALIDGDERKLGQLADLLGKAESGRTGRDS